MTMTSCGWSLAEGLHVCNGVVMTNRAKDHRTPYLKTRIWLSNVNNNSHCSYSLALFPGLRHYPVFDCLQYAKTEGEPAKYVMRPPRPSLSISYCKWPKTGTGEGLGTRLVTVYIRVQSHSQAGGMGMEYMQDWLLRCSSPVVHAIAEWDSPNTATQEHTVGHRQGHWGRKYVHRLVSGIINNSFTWREG